MNRCILEWNSTENNLHFINEWNCSIGKKRHKTIRLKQRCKTMTTLTDPCNHLKQQLAAALQVKRRYVWSKPIVYVLSTQSFEYSVEVPHELDELITYLKQEIDDYERSVRI